MADHDQLASYGELCLVLEAIPVLLRETRRRKHQTMAAAGDDIGVAASTVMRWERRESEPGTSATIRILRWVEQ